MTAPLSKIEKLARDICWAEFATKRTEPTKAAYWRCVHPDQKAEYISKAEWLVFICQKLKPLRILAMVDYPASSTRSRRAPHPPSNIGRQA